MAMETYPLLSSLLETEDAQYHQPKSEMSRRKKKNSYYIAACLYNNAGLVPKWGDNLVMLARYLAADDKPTAHASPPSDLPGTEHLEATALSPIESVFVSIYENDSRDSTAAKLRKLDGKLDGAGVVRRHIVSEKRGNRVESDRIDRLSHARNRALAPLFNMSKEHESFDYVIFLNDIAFTWQGIVRLVATPAPYDVVCGMDAQKLNGGGEGGSNKVARGSNELYDIWVNRDCE